MVVGHSKSIALTHTLVLSHLHNVKTERREHRCLATTHVVSTCSMHRYVVFGLDFLTITFFLFFYDSSFETIFLSLLQIEPFSLSLSFSFFLILLGFHSTKFLMTDQPTDYSSIDAFHVGRRRKPNFTDHEVLNIINQYDEYKDLLHSREASKSVIAQKQAIWKQITENLNATYPQVERTVEDVRRKWKKLQSEAKREVAAYRAAQLAGSSTPASNKQMTLYNRILSICRAPLPTSSTSHFAHAVAVAAAMQRQQAMQFQSTINNGMTSSNNHETNFNEQVRIPMKIYLDRRERERKRFNVRIFRPERNFCQQLFNLF